MTSRLKTMDKENEIESDWKFAAMVIDRWVMGVIVMMVMMTMMVMMVVMSMVNGDGGDGDDDDCDENGNGQK